MDTSTVAGGLIDGTMLARLQFAFTISVHIIFPAFSIGLAAFIATLLVRWRLTGDEQLRNLAQFWTKIFAVSFAMGVVSGLVLSYQIGTNWSGFSVATGNILGPLIGYEVQTAFFLEASFLGIMLFGWNRVSPNLHVTAAVLVAIGTSMSAFWILSANSWMQTPAGYSLQDGVAVPEDWFKIIFNPSFPYRFAHMFTAAYLTTSLVVASVGARYMLAGKYQAHARTMLHMGLGMVAILAPLQAVIGDQHGLNTLQHQPQKVAAIEAHWQDEGPIPLVLFAWPDEKAEVNNFEIAVPRLGSIILTHSLDGRIKGLKDFAVTDRPPVKVPFFAFRAMVGVGFLLIAIGFAGVWLWYRGKLYDTRWYLSVLRWSWPLGFIAILSGWYVTEVGRQPWLATDIIRTADAVSPVPASAVIFTLTLFVLVYCIVFSMGIYYINRLIVHGPARDSLHDADGDAEVANRPLSAAEDAVRAATRSGAAPAGGRAP